MKSIDHLSVGLQKSADAFGILANRAEVRRLEVETLLKRRQRQAKHKLCVAFFGCATCRAWHAEKSGLYEVRVSALAAQSSLLSEASVKQVNHATEALDSIIARLKSICYPKRATVSRRTAWHRFIAKGVRSDLIANLRRNLDYVHGRLQ